VQYLVDSQGAGLTESLATFGTLEGLLLGVYVSVARPSGVRII